MRTGRDGQSGFLLLEVLVAFAIAILAFAVLMQGVGDSARNTRAALDGAEAVVRARSRMAALSHGGLVPGEREGDDGGGFHWRTDVAALDTAADGRSRAMLLPNAPLPRQTLYAVRVEIEWRGTNGQRRFTLRSERLGPALGGP
jgi:general secretion pathway protein I